MADRLRLHRPGAARQRRRLGPPPRRRAALHADVRGLQVRGDRRRSTARYPQDQPYPPVPPAGRAGRQLAPLLRADAGSGAVDEAGPAGDRILPAARRARAASRSSCKQKLPKGEAYLETEAPKGQMGFMVVGDGSPVPWRVRVRSSSFCNLSVHAGAVPRLPDRRHAGDRRLAWTSCWGEIGPDERGFTTSASCRMSRSDIGPGPPGLVYVLVALVAGGADAGRCVMISAAVSSGWSERSRRGSRTGWGPPAWAAASAGCSRRPTA